MFFSEEVVIKAHENYMFNLTSAGPGTCPHGSNEEEGEQFALNDYTDDHWPIWEVD